VATSDFDAKYEEYQRSLVLPRVAGTVSLVALVGTAVASWFAVSAWMDVPPRPVFQVAKDGASLAVEGDW